MEFRILGPLEVVGDGGRPVELPRRKSRALLGFLLLHANEMVSTDRLVDALWGAEPPRTATASLQNAVSRLRSTIGAELVVSRPPGYELRVDPDRIDLKRFERLVGEARTAPEARAAKLREALSLWRGAPLADLIDEPFAETEIARLDELRAAATEEWIDAELDLGRDSELIQPIEALIARDPHAERPRRQLMLALYRAGRQAEALEAYLETRALLVSQVGAEPGEDLQALHRAILVHDPALAARTRTVAPTFDAARKRVTALVVELTEPGADPERHRATLERFGEDVRIVVQRHGGHVHVMAGDTLTVLFGVAVAHEDDAFRAVRSGRDVAALAVENAEVRVALDTGEAFVRGERVTGDAAANAHRLLEAAEPGDVVVGAATLALVRNAVDATRIEGARARGRALDAFRLVSIEDDAPPVARDFDAPFVGRRHEIARLEDELRLAFSERRCRVVTLVGEAGIGKSRLARELVERTGDASVVVGRCVSYGEGATYLPLAEVVRRAVGEPSEEAIAAKLPNDEERALVAERIAGLVGISDTVVPGGDAFWAVRRFLEALARERPLIVFVDDVHWAEPTFLDLIEHLRDWVEDAPLLVLCAARPELLELRPAWGASAIVLGRLADDESRTLVDTLASELADQDRARVVETAEGNPLYLEQLVAAMGEGDEEIPPSIEALLAGRLDRLSPDDRALLQRASVIGREFDVAALAELAGETGPRVIARLATLARRGLVRARGNAYRFHHVLMREAAYASAPKEERAKLHARAATLAATDELVGFHLETAYRYGVELGNDDDALATRAGSHLGRAGMRAFARGDAPAAQGLLERAITLLPGRDPAAIELRCELGIVRWIAGRQDAMSTLRDAQSLALAVADRRLELRAQLELAFIGLHAEGETDAQHAIQLARDAIPTFEEFEDDRALGRAWYLVATVESSFFCRNAESIEAIERAITHYRRADFPPSVCVAHLASALHFGPTPIAEAISRCRALLTEGEAGRNGETVVRMWLAALEAKLGRFPSARSLLGDAEDAFRQLGQAGSVAGIESVRADVELLAGDHDAAVRHLVTACESYEELGLMPHLATEGAHLAEVLHAAGRLDDARTWLEKSEPHVEPGDISARFTCRAARARLAASDGDLLTAEGAAREAVELVDSTDALNQRATVRLTLAHVLDVSGRHDEAAAVRTTALGLFEAKGNLVAADATRALLAGIPA